MNFHTAKCSLAELDRTEPEMLAQSSAKPQAVSKAASPSRTFMVFVHLANEILS